VSVLIANGIQILLGGYDLTCDAKDLNLAPTGDVKDATTFCNNGWKSMVPGLKMFDFKAGAFWQANATTGLAVHDQAWADLGTVVPTTVIPDPAEDVAVFFQLIETEANEQFQIGELAKIDISGKSASGTGIIGGRVGAAKAARTTLGSGSVLNIPGGIAAPEQLYAAVHVFAVSGTTPTLDVTVKSASSGAFTSPTTRLTAPTLNSVGATWATPVAPVTSDAYWRVDWSIGGTTPSFTFAVAIGIA
jgi:hypothetical protein